MGCLAMASWLMLPSAQGSGRILRCCVANNAICSLLDRKQEGHSVRFTRRQLLPHLAIASINFMNVINVAAAAAEDAKQQHLSIDQIKAIIQKDIEKGQYYVTGNLTKSIYSSDCRFIDPTTDVSGVDKYVAAISALFDPSASSHELTSIRVASPSTIEAKWRLEGYLKFPWRPHIQPYEGTTIYTVNNNGLIVSHEETWDISLLTALLEVLRVMLNGEEEGILFLALELDKLQGSILRFCCKATMVKKKTTRQKVREKAAKGASKENEGDHPAASQDVEQEIKAKPSVQRKITKQLRFLTKLRETQAALSAKKVISKKKSKQRRGKAGNTLKDLSSLAEFLPDLQKQEGPPAPAKSKKILKHKHRQELVVRETKQLAAVLAHPEFQADPYAAIYKHLVNTIPQSTTSKQTRVKLKQKK